MIKQGRPGARVRGLSMLEWCQWLEDTSWALPSVSRLSLPLLEGSHVMALAISVGAVLWFDLRLLGWTMRDDRVSDVFRQVRPWMLLGFAVMFVTGVLLFAAAATDAYASLYFRLKLALLMLGGRQHRACFTPPSTGGATSGIPPAARRPGAARRRRVAGAVVRDHRRGPNHGLQPVNGGRSMKRLVIVLSLAALVLTLTSTLAWAQATGGISGTVRDQSGAVLPGVTITATQTETGATRTTVSNETGVYSLPNLPLGPYRLEAALAGLQHVHADRHRAAGEQQSGDQPGARRRRSCRSRCR